MNYSDGGKLFTHTFPIHTYDCDDRLRLTVFAVMRFFGEIALLQSEDVRAGFDYYAEHSVAWLLRKWDIRIRELPAFGETARVATQPRSYRAFAANRAFTLAAGAGATCIEAQSQWIFIDTARGRPARVHEYIRDRYDMPAEAPDVVWEEDPPPLRRCDAEHAFTVRRSDIDYNGHVNNIRYVEWALEAVPAELLAGRRLSRLLVQYLQETRYGADVQSAVEVEHTGDRMRCVHAIRAGDREVCRLRSDWMRDGAETVPRVPTRE